MDETSDDAGVGRRTVLRRSAGVAAGSAALVGTGAAQETGTASGTTNGTANGTGTDTDAGGESAAGGGTGTVTNAAIPRDAPKFGKPDFTGMFVRVGSTLSPGETPSVGTCPFFRSDDQVQTYAAILVSPSKRELERGARIYGRTSDEALEAGKTYVVNHQQPCGGGLIQLQLEEVANAPRIDRLLANLNESSGGVEGGGTQTTTTSTTTPGFGVGAAVAGLATGVGYALRRGD